MMMDSATMLRAIGMTFGVMGSPETQYASVPAKSNGSSAMVLSGQTRRHR